MAYYKPLQGLKGVQTDFNKYQFSWNRTGNDCHAHFLWIYKEDEPNMPQVWKYAQCIENRIHVTFRYNNVPLQEIRKIKFLAFLSDEQRAPSREDIISMSRKPEFLCEVCCGTGQLAWKWIPEKVGIGLMISSDKKIPEGILYYSYSYGNKLFCFDVPGEINCGDNYYGNIYLPDLAITPQIQSREPNLKIYEGNVRSTKKTSKNMNNCRLFKKIADMIRY